MSKPPTAGTGESTSRGPAAGDDGRSSTPAVVAVQTPTTQIPAAGSVASSQVQSSSLLSSTSAGAGSSSASSNTASEITSTQTPHATPKGSNTGLIAGIAVLAVLLAIALAAIGFLIFRKKRKAPKRGEYEPSFEQKSPLDPSSTVGLDNLESDVKSRDNRIRELQAALLKQGRGDSDIDDRQVRSRFTALSQSINDWVMTYFKGKTFTSPTSSRTLELLRRVAPSYDRLLQDPRMKYLVIRAVVMGNITEAFMASEFFPNIPFNQLKQGFSRYASHDRASEWRALTVGLLQSMPDFGGEKASSVQKVTARIESMISELAGGLSTSNSQTKNLQMIVDTAADLSVELDKQQATYVIGSDQVNSRFESEIMEDVSQAQDGSGRAVQAVVFPSLKKVTGSTGTVISKAQVVI